MPERRGQGFVDLLVTDPQLVADLLKAHIPDANGRCSGCAQDDRLREAWPCGVQKLAAIAQQRLNAWSVR